MTDKARWTLPKAQKGLVITRFPPEASGYLHLGHAKAALINYFTAKHYDGKMILRFDDTNPDKENKHFEQIIMEDLQTLGIVFDIGPTFTSDYIPNMLGFAERLIIANLAYVDQADPKLMQEMRAAGQPTSDRSNSVERNLTLWQNLLDGKEGLVLRAKISVDDTNFTMRDPVLYRVKKTQHPRQGDKYKAYPTYDFACPIVDSLEGVTHCLRTSEYNDRDAQYYWILDALGLRKPLILDYSRLNLEFTVTSKRKLSQLVSGGQVDGWDDPRMPTIRGLLRRGLIVQAIREIVEGSGMSRTTTPAMEWSKIWAINKKIIDSQAPRITAVGKDAVVFSISNFELEHLNNPSIFSVQDEVSSAAYLVDLHPKLPEFGQKMVWRTKSLLIERADVDLLHPIEEVTVTGWGNVILNKTDLTATLNLTGNYKTTRWKLHGLSVLTQSPITGTIHEYDNLIKIKRAADDDEIKDIFNEESKFVDQIFIEPAINEYLIKGKKIQLERRGFFIIDSVDPLILVETPDGKTKVNHLSARLKGNQV